MPLVDQIFPSGKVSLTAVPYTAFSPDGEAVQVDQV